MHHLGLLGAYGDTKVITGCGERSMLSCISDSVLEFNAQSSVEGKSWAMSFSTLGFACSIL